MKEQQLQDKLDEYYNRGIQHGIRMMKDKMLLACRKGTPIEIDGRVYYIRSDLDLYLRDYVQNMILTYCQS